MRVEPGNFLASILQFGKRLFLDHQRSLRRQNARRKVDRQLRRHLVRFESDGSVRIGHANVRIAAMGHGPVEVVRILDDVGRKAFADARNRRVRNRFFFFEPTDFSSNLIESIISEWLVVNPVSCIFHDNPTIVAY